MPTVAELVARVVVQGVESAQAKLASMGGSVDGLGSKLALGLAGAGVVAGVALAAIGAKSVSMAGDFEQSTNTLITSAGLQRKSIDAVRQGILQMAVDTGTGTDQLVKGMFNVQSALHLGAGGLQVLKAAAEGAKAENSDLAQTTDVLTTAMVNYHLGASQAVGTMNSLIVTVANGKMHMNDLTGSLKNVLPISAALKVQLSDVEGALATMANAGDRGTSAGTHLAMMLKMLANPASTARNEMSAMGIDSDKLAQTMRTSLPNALQMIQDAVAQHFTPGSVQYNRAIQTILGGSKSGIAGLELFGQGMKQLGQNTRAASDALHKGGKDVENWDTIQNTFNFKLDRAKEALEALGIKIGTVLLPVLGRLLDWFVSSGVPALQRFGDYLQNTVLPAIQRFGAWMQANVLPVLQRFGAFILNNVVPALKQFGGFLHENVLPVLQQIGGFIKDSFEPVWKQLVDTWKHDLLPALKELWTDLQPLMPILKVLALLLGGTLLAAVLLIIGGLLLFIKIVTLVWTAVIKAFGFIVKAFADGVTHAENFVKTVIDNFNKFKQQVGAIFNAIGTFIHDKILWIYNHNYYVKAFVDLVRQKFHDLQVGVTAVFNFIASWIGQKLDQARQFVTNFKNALGDQFNQLGTTIHNAVTSAWNWLQNFVAGWPSQAYQWGANLIQGIINGIGSKIGGVVQAAQNVASKIASILGFHSPAKEGPGRDADKWMPNLMYMFTEGIMRGTPSVQRALAGILSPIGTSLSVNATGTYTPSLSSLGGLGSSSSAAGQPVVLQIDGRTFARLILPHVVQNIRTSTGVRV